jgi:hypothetical protein
MSGGRGLRRERNMARDEGFLRRGSSLDPQTSQRSSPRPRESPQGQSSRIPQGMSPHFTKSDEEPDLTCKTPLVAALAKITWVIGTFGNSGELKHKCCERIAGSQFHILVSKSGT